LLVARCRLKAGSTNLTLISAELLNHCLKEGSKDNMTAVIVMLPAGKELMPKTCCAIS
jgi:serine/threonine protein phosphatase PrpC